MSTPLTWEPPNPAWTWDSLLGLTWDGNQPILNPPHIMTEDNRVSATMAAADIAAILAAVTTINSKLPFLISISNQERQEMPKLGDKSMGFDDKSFSFMNSNPEFLPGFILLAEVAKDRGLRDQINQFFPQLRTLCENVSDTLMVVNSELWMADLAYYQSVREAARRARPGADTVYNDLKVRFPGNPQPPAPTPTPGP